MHAIERAEYILSMLEKNKVVMVTDLSREMGVTEETVRKDLEKLEKQEKLNRVHGGAYLNEGFGNETPISVRSKVMQEEKKLLASLCMQWIHEKSSIFLDCSTTALHIAKQLADFPGKLTVMTNSLAVAKEIDANPQIRLILFGGELNRDREAFEGQTVLEQMKTCFINYAFVSSAGCSLEAGITDSTREEADIRRQVLKQAKHKILVVDNTKIGRNEVYVIGELEQLSQVVVDHSIRKTNPDLWEWFQAHQQISPDLANSQRAALAAWLEEYPDQLGIALTDCITMDAFLRDFGVEFASRYQGLRHDSGDPVEWGEKAIAHYEKLGIDPQSKTLVFSDNLDLRKAVELYRHFSSRVQLSFGIGTRLTCDIPQVKPLNIVIKLVECNGKPVAKLSDSPGKTICHDKAFVRALRKAFDLPHIKKAS